MKLSPEQVQQFKDDGVLIAREVLTDEDLQPVIDELAAFVDRKARQLQAEGKITDLHEDANFENRIARLAAQSPEIGQGMDIMELLGEAMFAFLHNKNLLDAVECLLGPELTCNPIQHVRAKVPGGPGGYLGDVPWHQDLGVMWPEADETQVITVWLPLVDATRENGCMEVLPGGHKFGYINHTTSGGTMIEPQLMPGIEPLCAQCPKRGVVFMNKLMPHKGLPNTTTDSGRWTIDLRYQVSDTPTGRPFHPAFVVRSADASRIQDDHAQWARNWREALEKSKGMPGHREAAIKAGVTGE